jgi:8-oxo-dGTP diphosphatase
MANANPPQPACTQIGAALIRRRESVLLVLQRGRRDPRPTWSIPGGRVDPGELPTEAMVREVREETGLEVTDPGRLLYVTSYVDPSSGARGTTFVFEVRGWRGEIRPPDPHDSVRRARFVPVPEAIELLGQLPWRMMREPILAHLRGEADAGALWQYRQEGDAPALVARLALSGEIETGPWR